MPIASVSLGNKPFKRQTVAFWKELRKNNCLVTILLVISTSFIIYYII